jgi:hypothetical protein
MTVTAAPVDYYRPIRSTALAVWCPVAQCKARPGTPCVVSGESPLDYHLRRLDEGLMAEYPGIRDHRDERRTLQRRWRAAL